MMLILRRLTITIFTSFLVSGINFLPAYCQDSADSESPSLAVAKGKLSGNGIISSSTFEASSGFFGTGISFEGGSSESKVKTTTTFELPPGFLKQTRLSLELEVPIDKESERTDLVTDFDLNGDYTGSFSFTRSIGGFSPWDYTPKNNINSGKIIEDIAVVCRSKTPTDKHEGKCNGNTAEFWADPTNSKDYATDDQRSALKSASENLQSAFDKSSYSFLGITGSIGQDTQKFRSSLDFSETKATKMPWGASAFYGFVPKIGEDNLKSIRSHYIGINYEVEYESASSQTLCRAAMENDPIECFTSAFSAPEKERSTSVYATTRYSRIFSKQGIDIPIAFEIKVAYNLTDNDFGVELPLYLTPDKDGNLVSGIRFRYDEGDDDEFSVGFFVGQKFDLFGTGG